ncbi:hypothetical protein FCH28_04735 [Streptomyces piniterrae]|uniref:Phospholipase n=1 Tax=Streptomyces piniterrae TaxID=2571125 RepID=A0A4U0NQI3_9ACTN|nr:hypothetical protein [Streptomyces piniterrae]TJZ56831.1 hypothetical protein FCH28_04735 [Streptomyces piniterrae]
MILLPRPTEWKAAMGKHRKPSDSRTARRMGMGVATATLGLTGLGFGATTAQAATAAPDAPAANSGASGNEFFDRSYEKCLDDQSSSGLSYEQQVDACTGKLREGPGEPDSSHPGAKFDPATYQKVAQLPNDQFIELRNKSLDAASDGELQRSFYSNGCTRTPSDAVSQKTMDACIQHDFRYTVGPNVYDKNSKEGQDDRAAADAQLGQNIGGMTGQAAAQLTGTVGSSFYNRTETGQQNANELLPR